jgi:hypothetical protein
MREHEERYESSRASEATPESGSPTPSEREERSHRSTSSSKATSSEDDGSGGEDRESGPAVSESPSAGTEGEPSSGEERTPLFTGEEAERFRERWANVQAGFVDEPRQMVEEADDLVGDLMRQLTAGFSEQRSKLEEQWSGGDEVSTEDLRVALTRYRSFFNRLLSA